MHINEKLKKYEKELEFLKQAISTERSKVYRRERKNRKLRDRVEYLEEKEEQIHRAKKTRQEEGEEDN